MLSVSMEPLPNSQDPLRELFEACKTGDIARVRKLITPQTVNARDTAGRKSTPLHFAAGLLVFFFYNIPLYSPVFCNLLRDFVVKGRYVMFCFNVLICRKF